MWEAHVFVRGATCVAGFPSLRAALPPLRARRAIQVVRHRRPSQSSDERQPSTLDQCMPCRHAHLAKVLRRSSPCIRPEADRKSITGVLSQIRIAVLRSRPLDRWNAHRPVVLRGGFCLRTAPRILNHVGFLVVTAMVVHAVQMSFAGYSRLVNSCSFCIALGTRALSSLDIL